ncbi:MAG TPA: hypothetical protein VEV84_01125 [Pyrinomonadaceae bacterium]|nr:hypothetical protein [Pyrinomonadaceae bacterium]
MRTLAPADSLIYLETNDLGATLQPIIDSDAFNQAAKSKPDLSTIKGVQLAIVVTGFETTENKISDENSELNFKPHFVAIADTHAWQWQTNSFAENQLGEFINKVYGGGVQLDTSSKDGGTGYVWTAEDGRKAYGFVTGSLILFGNDESSIEKVQAVRRGEADAISKVGKLPSNVDALAIGYVSTDGIAQISNIVGAQKAKESGEESETQSFIARVLPQLLRGSIKDATWIARKTENGIEDQLTLAFDPEVANVLSETMAPSDNVDNSLLEFVSSDATTVTQYNLKNPQIAWRSVLLLTQKLTDPTSGKIIAAFSNSFFEPYGVKDGEMFLSSISPSVATVKYDEDDAVAAIAKAADPKARKNSLDPEFAKTEGANIEITDPGFEGIALNGDTATVQKCIQAHQNGQNLRSDPSMQSTAPSIPAARTRGIDRDSAALLAEVLNEKKSEDVAPTSRYLVETRFNKTGIERRLVSDFGLIGSIVAMLASEE